MSVDVILLYYYRESFGPTVFEHLSSFEQFSQFNIIPINTAGPDAAALLREQAPSAILLHYTLFGMQYYLFTEEIQYLVGESRAVKAAFFQDEYYHCPKRFRFINEYEVDVVYTLFEPQTFPELYFKYTNARMVRHTLAGYVSQRLIDMAEKFAGNTDERKIDVGYRGHELDICYGLGGREKTEIASRFKDMAKNSKLKIDVETSVDKRIYGDNWYRFIADCKGMLGVEAGVSAVDIEDRIRLGSRDLRRKKNQISDKEIYEAVVAPYEGNHYYRMISPRHFEAAALGTCQILFEGKYTGVMVPEKHYIPLKRDFSNIDEALEMLNDENTRTTIVANAKMDLIDSGHYSYEQLVQGVDRDLKLLGL